MRLRKLINQYGIVFFGSYLLTFVILVALKGQLELGTVPGDISFGESFYLPITSSLAIAAFVTIIIEFYKFTK